MSQTSFALPARQVTFGAGRSQYQQQQAQQAQQQAQAAQQAQQQQSPTLERAERPPELPARDAETSGGSGGGELDDEPLYVNAKQYNRIIKRRLARARLEHLTPMVGVRAL